MTTETNLIIVNDYCHKCQIEPSFIIELEEGGLLEVYVEDGIRYISDAQLRDLERYIRLHYDLSINIAGIDAICHLLHQIDTLQHELKVLRQGINS